MPIANGMSRYYDRQSEEAPCAKVGEKLNDNLDHEETLIGSRNNIKRDL